MDRAFVCLAKTSPINALLDHMHHTDACSSVCRSLLFHVVQHWVNVYNCVYTQCHVTLSVASYPGCSSKMKATGLTDVVTTETEEQGSICVISDLV